MAAGYAYAALAGYQIITGLQQADIIREQAEITKQLAALNAEAALVDAFHAEQQGESQVARYQTVIDQTISNQNVAFAVQDIDVGYGTAAALQQETKLNAILNQADIRAQAQAVAAGFKRESRNIRLQSYLGGLQSDVAAGSTARAAYLSAARTGLSGYNFGSGGTEEATQEVTPRSTGYEYTGDSNISSGNYRL